MVSETSKGSRESEGKAKGIEGQGETVVDTRGLTKRWTGARYASLTWFALAQLVYIQRPVSLVVRLS